MDEVTVIADMEEESEFDTEVEELEEKTTPGRGYNHNQTLVREN